MNLMRENRTVLKQKKIPNPHLDFKKICNEKRSKIDPINKVGCLRYINEDESVPPCPLVSSRHGGIDINKKERKTNLTRQE